METASPVHGYDWLDLVKQYGSPLLVLDCNTLRNQYRRLKNALPKVDLYFAIKALPNETVIDVLNKEGCHFDIATQGEVRLLEKNHVPPKKTIQPFFYSGKSAKRNNIGNNCENPIQNYYQHY